MSCLLASSILLSCEDKLRVGGVNKRFWIGNKDELESITYVGDDPKSGIESVTLASTTKLYKFEGFKQSQSGGNTLVPQTGGNKFFQHDVSLKLPAPTPEDKAIIETLSVADIFVVLETNSGEFIWYGFKNGLDMVEETQNTGTEFGSDTTFACTFSGAETVLPINLMAAIQAAESQYEANLAYMETLETAAP